MRILRSILAGGAGLAAVAAAGPAAAQYGYNPYAYSSQYGGYSAYGNAYGAYGMNTSLAEQQCTAAVQNRLYTRSGLSGVLRSLIGASGTTPRVVGITRVSPMSYGMIRVRGLASSGRYANPYSPYGYGAYGALGYNTAASADLSFRCDVDARGFVRNVDINRRY